MTLSSPPGKPADLPAAGPPPADARPSFLDWLPWEKILIWGLFLLAVYALRHFFFIIFMTFILTYIMRSIVLKIARFLSPRGEPVWLERSLTVVCFALFLFGLYEAGHFVGPRLSAQGEALFGFIGRLDPEKEFHNIVAKTLGAYRFHRMYSGKDDPKYQEDFEEYRKIGPHKPEEYYEKFPNLKANLEQEFEKEEERRFQDELESRGLSDKDFEEWFISKKALEVYKADEEHYLGEWERGYKAASVIAEIPPLEEIKKRPGFKKDRDEKILRIILEEQTKDPKKRADLRKEWKDY